MGITTSPSAETFSTGIVTLRRSTVRPTSTGSFRISFVALVQALESLVHKLASRIGATAGGFDVGHRSGQLVDPLCGDDHGRTGSGQRQGEVAAEAAGSSGHQRSAPAQAES